MRGIWQGLVQSTSDLTRERQRLVSGTFSGRPLLELEAPRALADALVGHMAPVVAEISRRSGAPGELVLRRTLSEGRREETYCTHTELLEKIMVLPPDLRVAFSALHLSGVATPSRVPPVLPPGQDVAGRPLLQAAPPQPLPVEPFGPADIEVTAETPALPHPSAPLVVRVS
jgi:hypothetical protein